MAEVSRVCSMAEAVERYVPDGASVAMGMALEALIPFAAGHELIRQRRGDLELIGPISDMLFDQLIGAGCARKVTAAWVGNVSAGLGHNFRRAREHGQPPLELEQHSNFSIGLALQAAALGVPYLPSHTLLGSDLVAENPRLVRGGDGLLHVQALRPDVAIVHVQRADRLGHAHCWGNLGLTREAALAADRIILVAERLVPEHVILSDPNRILVPPMCVAAVVVCPGGAHPSPVPGAYARDHQAFANYHHATRERVGFEQWRRTWIDELPDRAAYLTRLGPRWPALAPGVRALAAPVDYA
ncbi:MAG: CoA transferase subunit A [Chloroflexi bacterium]|nr:CoA transferase subunit A [Chloroflexota bacterium]